MGASASIQLGGRNGKALMLGLDNGGKTTLLYALKLSEVVSTIPTIGFNVETIQCGPFEVTAWDIGGQSKLRKLWIHYRRNMQMMFWVVDSCDIERLVESREELLDFLEDKETPRDVPIAVLCNKQDRPEAVSAGQVRQVFFRAPTSWSPDTHWMYSQQFRSQVWSLLMVLHRLEPQWKLPREIRLLVIRWLSYAHSAIAVPLSPGVQYDYTAEDRSDLLNCRSVEFFGIVAQRGAEGGALNAFEWMASLPNVHAYKITWFTRWISQFVAD